MKKPTVEQRRTEILQTTCDVVIERGFAATRMNDVAKKLGVSTSLIHYHFDSKEQLLAEAFAYYARKDLDESLAEIEAAPTATQQLDRTINNYVPEGSDDVEWMLWIDGWGEALRNPMMRKISQELDEQSIELMQRVIEHGCQTGEFVCPEPRLSAIRITGLVDGLAVQFAAHDGMMDRAAFINHVRTVAAAEVGLTLADFDITQPTLLAAPSVATESALRQLVDRYCDAVYRKDADAWISTWTDDAEWRLRGDPLVGREAILGYWLPAMDRYTWVVQTAPLMVFEVDEANGEGVGRVIIEERFKRADGSAGTMVACYHDRYRRDGRTWRFAARTLDIIAPPS